jgi:cytosine/adenosine deaminase-related metal-dependent hydrolase
METRSATGASDMPTLIRGATIITVEPHQPVMTHADLLIEGDRIAAIGASGTLGNALGRNVIDAIGCIVIPGLVNAHMHTWQTALRGVAANWTLLEYFGKMHAGLATVFEPDDLYIATLLGGLNQLNCGTTMLGDWCHNNRTPEHNDAAISGLLESGIRATFFHGTPKPDPKPGEQPFWERHHPRSEIERLIRENAQGKPLLNIGAAILGPHYSTMDVALHDFRMADELGLIASMHQGGGPARTPEGWQRLEAEGLLGKHINIVHGHALNDEQLKRFIALGMSFSVAAESEMSQGHGHPITGRLRKLGAAPSLGVDLESLASGDMFTQARIALGIQRSLDNEAERAVSGSMPKTSSIRTEEALQWVTIEGARMLGMEHKIGSIAVGKQADLVILDATMLNMQPLHDPVASVVFQASLANVRDVMVAGLWRKRDHKLLAADLPKKIERLNASGVKITRALGL